MRVLQLLSSTGFHGSETMTAELVRQLAALGVKVHLGVLDNGGRGDRTVLTATQGCSTPVIVPCNSAFDAHTARFLRGYINQQRIDVIHSHKYKTTFYALWAARRTRVPVIATYHNWLTDTAALRAYALLDKALARFCSAAVGVSTPVENELRRWAPASRVHQIDNGIDTDRFVRTAPRVAARKAVGLPAGGPLIGFVGRLSAAKGLDTLLAALLHLDTLLAQPARVAIVGAGAHRDALMAEVAARGLQERVRFLGARSDTPALYSAFDVFCLPSRVEAFPMVVLEAMACETPVVATAVGDVPRIIVDGESGLLVPPDQPIALAQALGALLRDPVRAAATARNARARVQACFTARAMAQRYFSLYEAVTAAKDMRASVGQQRA